MCVRVKGIYVHSRDGFTKREGREGRKRIPKFLNRRSFFSPRLKSQRKRITGARENDQGYGVGLLQVEKSTSAFPRIMGLSLVDAVNTAALLAGMAVGVLFIATFTDFFE